MLIGAGGLLAFALIRQRRLIEPLRRNAAQLDKLAGIGQAILGAQLQLDALCEVVYEQAAQIIDTTNFQLGLFDDNAYRIIIWRRDGQRQPGRRFPHAASEGLIGWVRRTGQELVINDFEAEWDHLPAKPSYESSNPSRSALFVPLAAGGESIGVIAVQSDTPYAFQTSDLRMLMVLTSQAAGAIRNAQLYEQAQERNRQLQLVSEVSQQVTAVQPLHDLFNQIVTSIHFTFGYYAVNIFTLDERDNRLVLRASSHPGFRDRAPRLEPGQGLVGWVAQNARTALVANATLDERYYDDGVLNETRAELTVPLVMERRVVGVLDIQSNRDRRLHPRRHGRPGNAGQPDRPRHPGGRVLRRRTPPARAPERPHRSQPGRRLAPEYRRPAGRGRRSGDRLFRLRPHPHLSAGRRRRGLSGRERRPQRALGHRAPDAHLRRSRDHRQGRPQWPDHRLQRRRPRPGLRARPRRGRHPLRDGDPDPHEPPDARRAGHPEHRGQRVRT